MKFQFLNLFLLAFLFLSHFMEAASMLINHPSVSVHKRDTVSVLESTTAIIENNSKRNHAISVINKRCGGRDDVDCLLGSVVGVLESILGGGSNGHYDGTVVDVVHTLTKAVRQLLRALELHGSHHDGAGGLDGLLGTLLGGHHHDDDDDFGCGCDGDALVDYLIQTIQDLLDQLVGCKDGLIPQLVDAVTDLLESLVRGRGGHRSRKGHKGKSRHGGKHDSDCGDNKLGLDCLLNTVVELVDSLLHGDDIDYGHGHGHGHGHSHSHGSHDNEQISGLVTQVVQLLHGLLNGLDLDNTLTLDALQLADDKVSDFGCGCDGDNDILISHLIKTLEHVLDQLADCDDDRRGLIDQLIKTVKKLLKTLGSSKHDHDIRERFDARRRRKHRGHNKELDLDLLEGVLDTIEELLDRLVGTCDDSLLGEIKDLVAHILNGLKEILECLRKGLLKDLLRLVRALVNNVIDLLARCDGQSELESILDDLVRAVKSLVSGCGLLGLIDLHRLGIHL